LFYDGLDGSVYKTFNLSSELAVSNDDPSSGYTFSAYSVYTFQAQTQNGPDGIALVDANDVVLDFIAYGGEVVGTNGPADGLSATLMGVVEASNTSPANSLQLGGVGFKASDFMWQGVQVATPGQVNTGQVIDCPAGNSRIADTSMMLSGIAPTIWDKIKIVDPNP